MMIDEFARAVLSTHVKFELVQKFSLLMRVDETWAYLLASTVLIRSWVPQIH